nr:zinc finger, CCHC-type [Tanacetum cinerariifolium]
MSFEEAIGRLTAYEERIKNQDTLEANDQDKLLMASSNNKTFGKWRGKDFYKEGKESMKWKNNPNARRISTSQGTKDKSKLRKKVNASEALARKKQKAEKGQIRAELRARKATKQKEKAHDAVKSGGTIKGLSWHQGESDTYSRTVCI